MSVKQGAAEHDFGEATVTSKGQITVPSALRQELGVSPGDRLAVRPGAGWVSPPRSRVSVAASSILPAPMRFAPAKRGSI